MDSVDSLPQASHVFQTHLQTEDAHVLLYKARCCKLLGLSLKKWKCLAYECFLESAVSTFSEVFLKYPNNYCVTVIGGGLTALMEAVSIAVEHGYTSIIPNGIFNEVDKMELFHSFQNTIERLTDSLIRQKVAGYIFLQSTEISNSGALSLFKIPCSLMWFLKNDIFSATLYNQLFWNGLKECSLSLITKAIDIADDDSCIVLLHHYSSQLDPKDAQKLTNKSLTTRKIKTLCHLMKVTQTTQHINAQTCAALERVFTEFEMHQFELFAQECSPQMRRELVRLVLLSQYGGNEKKFAAINAIVCSGQVDVRYNLDFREVIQRSLPLLVAYPSVLQKLFDMGFHITHKKEIVKLVIESQGILSSRVQLICTLLENGASGHSLKYACSHNNGHPIEGATELAVKTGNHRILELFLRISKSKENCGDLIDSFKQDQKQRNSVEFPRFAQIKSGFSKGGEEKKIKTNIKFKNYANADQHLIDSFLDEELNKKVDFLLEKSPEYFVQTQVKDIEEATEDEEKEIIYDAPKIELINPEEDIPAAATALDPEELNIDDVDFSSLPWTIVISKQAADFLKRKKTSKKVIKDVRAKLFQLGQGNRTHALCHKCIQPEDRLYETYLYRESRIIWQESIQYSETLSSKHKEMYADVIRVLWIATTHTTHQLTDVLQKIKTSLSKSRLSQSTRNLKQVSNECKGDLKMPRTFVLKMGNMKGSASINNNEDEFHPMPNVFEGEYSVMQFHPFPEFLDAYLSSDSSKFDTAICMSSEEHKIVHLPYQKEPIVLCGRSGTGKTTTCIYRMWNEFKTFHENYSPAAVLEPTNDGLVSEANDSLHQVFVTKSPVLCSQVKKHFEKLVNGRHQLKKCWVNCNIKDFKSMNNLRDVNYPLFLTSRQFLFLLDNSLPGMPFFCRDERGELIVDIQNWDYNYDMDPDALFTDTNIDNEEENKVCKMKWKEVTADFFCTKIWPRMKSNKNFQDPLLVWMEIQSFIKGSLAALQSPEGYIDENTYVNEIGKKMAPNYCQEDRKKIYECFLEYKKKFHKLKIAIGCDHLFDESDVINNIFNRLKNNKPNWYIDHFYIDEVQDFTQAELSLLLKCSRNPAGTFCTGDTAQSIMKGVFFRFTDLKCQFWTMAQTSSDLSVPKIQQLTENFRAHSGILNLAQSVVDIMKSKFPRSFLNENLPSEVAMFEGPKPILLNAHCTDDLTSILLGNINDSSYHELGAHQAIIVRTEESKQKLPKSLKDGIVLTVLEAKGLEFNDVLLYNFFTDSEVNKEWRIFYNQSDSFNPFEIEQLLSTSSCPLKPCELSEDHLKSLLAELKYLYTAITRAKVNLWVYDSSKEKRTPAFFFWLSSDLATFVKTDNAQATSGNEAFLFAAPSMTEQWAKQGDHYFRIGKWKLAVTCYKQAKMFSQLQVAEAYALVEEAKEWSGATALLPYKKAALAFLKSDHETHNAGYIDKAIFCLKKCRMHELSAKLLEKKNQMKKAAKEWAKTDKYQEHARVLEILGDYSGTVAAYVENDDYETALKKAVQFQQKDIQLKPAVKPQQIASDYVKKLKHSKDADQHVLKDLLMKYVSDGAVKADFLKEIGLYEEAVDELLRENQLREAYRIMKAQGLCSKGIKEVQDLETRQMFKLLSLKKEMSLTNRHMESLLNCSNEYWRGYAELLCAIINNDISYFSKAIKSFGSFIPGILMAYQTRFSFNKDCRVDMIEVFKMSSLASEVKQSLMAIANNTATLKQKNLFKDVLKVYDIEGGVNYYYIPEVSLNCVELTGLNLKPAQLNKDADGMIILDKRKALEQMTNFYSQIVHIWLSNENVHGYVLNSAKKLHSFSFHKELYQQSFQQAHAHSLLKYFHEIMTVLEFNSLCPECELPELENIKKAAISLFSFHTQFFISLNREFLNSVIRNSFSRYYFRSLANKIIEDNNVTLDHYFVSWTVSMIFSSIHDLKSHLNSKVTANDSLVLKYKRKTHIFFWWTHTWKSLVLQGRVISSCQTLLTQVLFRLHEVNQDVISISNLTYILTVFSSLLFTIMNISSGTYFVFPQIFKSLCDTFNCLKGNTHRVDIEASCINEAFNMIPQIQKAVPQLFDILQFLLGRYKYINILHKSLASLESLNDGSAHNCLVLCLVLVCNLYTHSIWYSTYCEYSTENIQVLLLEIQKQLHYCRKHSCNEVAFIEKAYNGLQLARNISDVWKVIVSLLDIHKHPNDIICPMYNMTLSYLPLYTTEFSAIKIKSLVIIENDQEDLPAPTIMIQLPAASGSTYANGDENEEIEAEYEAADEEYIPSKDKSLVEDDICLVCGINIVEEFERKQSVEEDSVDSHFKTDKHKLNHTEFLKWEKCYEETEMMNSNFKKSLEERLENENLVSYKSILRKSQSNYTTKIVEMEEYRKLCNWKMCQAVLENYQSSISAYLKEVEKIKEECTAVNRYEEEEEEETSPFEFVNPAGTMVWSKQKLMK